MNASFLTMGRVDMWDGAQDAELNLQPWTIKGFGETFEIFAQVMKRFARPCSSLPDEQELRFVVC